MILVICVNAPVVARPRITAWIIMRSLGYESRNVHTTKGRVMEVPPRPDRDQIDAGLENKRSNKGNHIQCLVLHPNGET